MFVWFKKRAVFVLKVLPPPPQDSTHSTVGWHLALAVYYIREQQKMLFIEKTNHQSEASLKKRNKAEVHLYSAVLLNKSFQRTI